MNQGNNIWTKLFDRIRRRIAYVPVVDDTIKTLKDVGVDLTEKK